MERLKVITVGDGGVGKSCLLITYATKSYPSEYVPTVFDNYGMEPVTVDGKTYELDLFDTGGQEDYDRLRPLCYPLTNVFLLCFAVDSPDSLHNVKEKWIPELRHFCPDVPVLLVGCKTDLRHSEERCITYSEGREMAEKVTAYYTETSSLIGDGLTACFDLAIQIGSRHKPSLPLKGGSLFGGLFKKAPAPLPPIMPPAGKAPWMEIETSCFADDWYKTLQEPNFSDVTFVLEGCRKLDAHKIILSTASKFFGKVVHSGAPVNLSQQDALTQIESFDREDLNSGRIEGISSVHENDEGKTVIQLSADIKAKTFVRVLEFIYTGTPRFPDDDTADDEIEELKRVAKIFNLQYLATICDNMEREEDFLNPSIGTYLNDKVGAKLKETYLNKASQADVVFLVNDQKIYAHKLVLCTRSDVMAAMFSGRFKESKGNETSEITVPNISTENFMALLEYLYSDHAPLEESSDLIGVLSVADEYCQPRLANLCELYISMEVDKACRNKIERAEIDVIGLLNTANILNAKQLTAFCRHFISTNYDAFSRRKEFPSLAEEDRKYVEENRWPPLSYLKEVEEFERKMAERGEKCLVM